MCPDLYALDFVSFFMHFCTCLWAMNWFTEWGKHFPEIICVMSIKHYSTKKAKEKKPFLLIYINLVNYFQGFVIK